MKSLSCRVRELFARTPCSHNANQSTKTLPLDSIAYWEERYRNGRDSGPGSYGVLAEYKASFLNRFVADHGIRSVIEFGCGDGHQLSLARYPSYLGLDVSKTAVATCRAGFAADPTKRFINLEDYHGQTAELALSLDVIFHLVEDNVFEDYMARLFSAGERFVIIYASNHSNQSPDQPPHVRHRRFTDWVEGHAAPWRLVAHEPNPHPFTGDMQTGSFADFHVFSRR